MLASGCGEGVTPSPRVDWRDRFVYQIMTDRFANGDPSNDAADGVEPVPGDLARMQGGDWAGIRAHLGYLEHLGVNAIWISPIVENVPRIATEDAYHGYWASDFTRLNPRFGTEAELRGLIADAHARGIAVLVDIAPNHTGRVFGYDLDGDGEIGAGEDEPPYQNPHYEVPLIFDHAPRLFTSSGTLALTDAHFHRRGVGNLGDYEQRRYGDFPTGLRDLDTENEEVIAALIATFAKWAIDLELDGYRVDAVPHVEMPFWSRFCAGVRSELARAGRGNFLFVGEIFESSPEEIARHTVLDALDSGFDFPLKFALIDRVILGGAPPVEAIAALETNRRLFRDVPQPNGIGLDGWQARLAIADNHDLSRIYGVIDDPFAADQALVAIFGVDAIPTVLYGTEQSMRGTGHHTVRAPLWEVGFDESAPSYRLIAHLAEIRRVHPALRYGSLVLRHTADVGGMALSSTAPDAGLIVWERVEPARGDGGTEALDRVLVVLNTHPLAEGVATIATGFAPGTRLFDALEAVEAGVVAADGSVAVRVQPRRSVWLVE